MLYICHFACCCLFACRRQGASDSGATRKVRELEDAVAKEKRQISELEQKYSLTLHQLDLCDQPQGAIAQRGQRIGEEFSADQT